MGRLSIVAFALLCLVLPARANTFTIPFQLTVNAAQTAILTLDGSSTGDNVSYNQGIVTAFSGGGGPGYDTSAIIDVCNGGVPLSASQCGFNAGLPFAFLTCTHQQPTTPITSGSCTAFVPIPNGNYVMAWFPNSSSFAPLASVPFTVGGAPGQPSINAVTLSNNSITVPFTGNVGTLSVTCSTTCPNAPTYTLPSGAVTGCSAGQVADNGSFVIVGSSTLAANGTLSTVKNYAVGVQVAMSATSNSPFCSPLTVSATNIPSIGSVTVSPNSFTAPGTFSGTLTTTCGVASCPSSPSYAFSTACSSNNNSSFTLASSGISSNGTLQAGNYIACIAVTMSGVTNSGAAFPVTIVGNGGGTACSANPNCPAAAAQWTLDPSLGDDFNGNSLDPGKWNTSSAGEHPPSSGCNLDFTGPLTVSGGFLHQGWTYDSGSNTFHAPLEVDGLTGPSGGENFYREIRWKWNTNNGNNDIDNSTWNFSPTSPLYPGTTQTHTEVDAIEFDAINWFLWANGGAFIINSRTGLATALTGNPYDGNFHIQGLMRNNGTWYFYWDNNLMYTMPDPMPPYFTNSSVNVNIMSSPSFSCPGTSGMASTPNGFELTTDYVHWYHP